MASYLRFSAQSRAFALTALLGLVLIACGTGGSDDLRIEHVHGLAVDGDTLYVATHFGLFVREQGEWSRRSEDRADHMGFSFVSTDLMFRSGHPEGGGNLGVQRSTDGGRTWETVSEVLSSPVDFHAMAAEGEPLALYGWAGTLYRSVSDPKSWARAEAEGLPAEVGALTVSGAGDVYASTNAGLHRSSDRGETWQRQSDRLVFALAVSRSDGPLYASAAREPRVLRSADGGATWEDASEGLGDETIVALGVDGETVAAADTAGTIWLSRDGGSTWSEAPVP